MRPEKSSAAPRRGRPGSRANAGRPGQSKGGAGQRSSPLHGAVYAQELARYLLEQGFSEEQVFDGTGFGPKFLALEKPVAEFDHIAKFYEHAADLTGDDALGFQRGQKRDMRRAGLITYIGLSAPTVRDLIVNTARYRRVFSDAVEIDAAALDQSGRIGWYFNAPSSVTRRQFVEFGASGVLYGMRQCANRQFGPELVTFRHPRNSSLPEFERFFGCEVRFGAAANCMQFCQGDLDLPLLTADDELYRVLKTCCEGTLKSKARGVSDLILDVDRTIAERLGSGQANQDNVARALGMSSRTLSRRLADEGTTYFRVLEELRKSLAVSYLRDSDLSLAETSYLLGYAGLGSFNDAFKRWTGQTPGQFRSF